MARIVYGAALGRFGYPLDFYDFFTLAPTKMTATQATLTDAAGASILATGTGLTYTAGQVTGGTITSVRFLDQNGAALYTVTQGNFDAVKLSAQVLGNDNMFALMGGRDVVIGTGMRDIIVGGGGNDKMRAGGASDVLVAMNGHDRMWGGGGPDNFVFRPNKGVDYIMDFKDDGGAQDDVIVMTHKAHDAMVMSQIDKGVLLDFGDKGSLIIKGALLENIGEDDFAFNLPHMGGL